MSSKSVAAEEGLGLLSNEKIELLKLLLEERSRKAQRITRYPRESSTSEVQLPASWAQQRLWFLDQLEGGSTAYRITVTVRLQGALNYQALQRALDTLVQRHEVLRTVFVAVDGEPKQAITAEGSFTLKMVDVSSYDEEERDAQVQREKRDEAREKFELHAGPLVRGRLLRVAAEEHLLLVTMHHIISDGWSKGVFISELVALYASYAQGRGDPLKPLPIQYADYAQWQRQGLHGAVSDKQLGYWRARLQGAAPQIELPTDRPRPAINSYRGENVAIVLDAQLSAEIRSLAQRREMTLFMVLHAAWVILLSRLSGQEDVVIGTPVANRQRAEIEGLIGFFVNTLVLRVRVQGDLLLEKLLDHVKETTLGAYDHQDMPFERIVEALQPQRLPNHNPLYQVVLVLLNTPRSELHLPGLTVSAEDDEYESSLFDLSLVLEERGDRIVGFANFATDLFDRETIERWMACLVVLLKGMTRDVHSRIGDLPLLPEDQRRQVIGQFNTTNTYPQSKAVHELFEEQVERTPSAIAVVYEGQSLTYAVLNEKANQLARYLRCKGVGPEELVGICMERGLEMIVGLLGILKAGGAYVPLDPTYPTDRLQYMLEDSAPRLLLTQDVLRRRLPATHAERIALDSDWSEIAQQASANQDAGAIGLRPHHMAYVIYTSGSTGKPKGVMVEHRNVTRLFAATEQSFGFSQHDVWSLFHSFAFDFSVWELWGALLYGGRVVVVPYLTARSSGDFYRLLCEEGVTVLSQTPSAFAQLIDAQASHAEMQHSLRMVIFGGEALELHTLRPWVERNGADSPQLVNMYGITETTVHVTYRAPLTREEIESDRCSLIGKPIADLRAYLLDQYRQPVPIGVAGEIYVGGAGVSRGYLNRPELTAERFITDPYTNDLQARLYRSGDLGRWRPDGTLEYLGRNDHQVKIRGFRIELAEIEARLATYAPVNDTVVVVREDVPDDKRLVAYVTQRDPTAISVEGMRAHLKTVLPDYMVPSAFVTLERFPLTSNGKLDRGALPAPELGAYVSRQYEAPQGDIEEGLAGIWQELLRADRVGRADDFFELGGHSLLAMQVIARIHSSLSIEMPIRFLFEFPTLQQLAEQVDSLRRARLLDRIADGGTEVEHLIEGLTSMSESKVQEWLRELTVEGRL